MKFYLGIDQGTTGVTALLFDKGFSPVARGYHKITQFYPAPNHVEHDPEQILAAVISATDEAMKKANATPEEIIAVGIDHEGESAMMWERESGKPIYPSIVWQDRRTVARAEELKAAHGTLFCEKTGLVPDAYFSATKLEWLMKNIPQASTLAAKGTLMAGNNDAFLLYRLSGKRAFATDASTASRTMLYNLKEGTWDDELLAICGIPRTVMPPIKDSMGYFGETDPDVFLGIKAPITALLNDQQSALLGQGCIEKGDLKTTYGTGCFMLMNTGASPVFSKEGLITTVAWQHKGKRTFALDGGVYIAGAAIEWLRDGLGLITSSAETDRLAESLADNGGVYFVPAFSGLGAPYRDPTATGTIVGICAATTKAHIARATLESIAYQVTDLASVMSRDAATPILSMKADGGITKSRILMDFQADMLGIPLRVPTFAEATARGAALAAAIGAEQADFGAARAFNDTYVTYTPKMADSARNALLATWHRATERAMHWNE